MIEFFYKVVALAVREEFARRILDLHKRWSQKVDWFVANERFDLGDLHRWYIGYSKAYGDILRDARRAYERKKLTYDAYSEIYTACTSMMESMKETAKFYGEHRLESDYGKIMRLI